MHAPLITRTHRRQSPAAPAVRRRLARLVMMMMLALVSAASAPAADHAPHRARLLDGVRFIDAPGIPGPLLVTGEDAFVVMAGGIENDLLAPVVAAGTFGQGRFVALGHTGYLGAGAMSIGDTMTLLTNAVRWCALDSPSPRLATTSPELATAFSQSDLPCVRLTGNWTEDLHDHDIILIGQDPLAPRDRELIQAHLRRGGGLIMAGLAWGWLQLNPGRSLDDHPGNQLLGPAGVYWADGYLKRTHESGYRAHGALPASLHSEAALSALMTDQKAETEPLAQAAEIAIMAVRTLPPDDRTLRPRLSRLLRAADAVVIPTETSPIGTSSARERFILTAQIEDARRAPAESVRPHPASSVFPGAVPTDVRAERRSLTINPAVPGWQSTGLYAPPGATIAVRVPPDAAALGLAVRIGCHQDLLYHKPQWKRAPEITSTTPITGDVTRAANAFGGLIYIDVPERLHAAAFDVAISGAIGAPRFVLGRTDVPTWADDLRNAPAPWAELETSKVILTVPSDVIRDLEDPEPVLRFWDQVLDAAADLAAIPHQRTRPERYVADVQISAGYMHAGYPIMTHLDAAPHMVSLDAMRAGQWGIFHELGHNHQAPEWTFSGTGEVTCNLFSLYIIDTLCDVPNDDRGHPGASGDVGLDAYVTGGSSFDQWKRDPFLALRMYIQMQDAFGWEPFKRLFAEYRQLPASERPRTDEQKRDQWMVRFSRMVGRNLGPFFLAWGVPTSETARRSIEHLPVWMPADLGAVE